MNFLLRRNAPSWSSNQSHLASDRLSIFSGTDKPYRDSWCDGFVSMYFKRPNIVKNEIQISISIKIRMSQAARNLLGIYPPIFAHIFERQIPFISVNHVSGGQIRVKAIGNHQPFPCSTLSGFLNLNGGIRIHKIPDHTGRHNQVLVSVQVHIGK